VAAVRLARFREISGLTADSMSDASAISALNAATAIANRIAGRNFGHAIEGVFQSGSAARLRINGHRLPNSGSVFIAGTGIATLDGEKSFTRVDENTISIASVTVPATYQNGWIASQFVSRARVMDAVAVVNPGPIALVKEVRSRAAAESGLGPFPASMTLNVNDWYCDTRVPNLRCDVEVYKDTTVYRRYRGLINPVAQTVLREIEVTYYAGFTTGVPDDLQVAITAFAQAIDTDPDGGYGSESFEDYSYQRLEPATVRALPTSAISVVLGYRLSP
jgi:hypothetical protein